jgi:hypothetical protein
MSSVAEATVTAKPLEQSKRETRRRGAGRRSRNQSIDGQRYFVAKASNRRGPLTLDREVASEAEALVAAFKGDNRVFVVTEYTVAQKLQGTSVTLVKELAPPDSSSRVSTTNES